jgi:hypothetical protein
MSVSSSVSEPNVESYLARPLAPVDPEVLAAIAQPMDAAGALALRDIDRLLDPAPLEVETGWCWTDEHVGYVAVRTPMPGTTAEMWEWWFDWHPRDPVRYEIWYPGAHFGISFRPPPAARRKPFWGAIHFPDEDIGIGRETIRIAFLAPSEYGFSTDAVDHPDVATVVGGHTGSATRHVRVGVMTHVFLRAPDGIVLRSRFWIGAGLRPDLPGALGDGIGRLIDRPAIRRRAIPADTPRALAHHCAVEYAHLAALLPELHPRFA